MIIKDKIKRVIEEEKDKDIQCDKCGESIMEDQYTIGGCVFQMDFGYGSNKDGNIYQVCLCDDCVDEFLGSLKQCEMVRQAWE